jgi:hypothetical protein
MGELFNFIFVIRLPEGYCRWAGNVLETSHADAVSLIRLREVPIGLWQRVKMKAFCEIEGIPKVTDVHDSAAYTRLNSMDTRLSKSLLRDSSV